MLDRYFDNAATTPVDPRVRDAMMPFLDEDCGNAHSHHSFGAKAFQAVEFARSAVASLLGADDPTEIVFTSGATEANNWFVQRAETVACTPFEHSSILEAVRYRGGKVLGTCGYTVDSALGAASLAAMHVNNETGAILDLPPSDPGTVIHRDVTQSLGKVPLPAGTFDSASCSAHKLYGPKGIGAFWRRTGPISTPLLFGGEHELGLRAGTLNVPGIVGFGEAATIALERMETDFQAAQLLREVVLDGLRPISDWRENLHLDQSPYILSVSFQGLVAQPLAQELDLRGFAVATGAACSSRSTEPSHVLSALGVEPGWLDGTIRISFGRTNTADSAAELAKELVATVQSARKSFISG